MTSQEIMIRDEADTDIDAISAVTTDARVPASSDDPPAYELDMQVARSTATAEPNRDAASHIATPTTPRKVQDDGEDIIEHLMRDAEATLKRGYRALKPRIGLAPRQDAAMVAALAGIFGVACLEVWKMARWSHRREFPTSG